MKLIPSIKKFIALVMETKSELNGTIINDVTQELMRICDLDCHMITSDGLNSTAIEDGMCVLNSAIKLLGDGKYSAVLFIEHEGEIFYCKEYLYRAEVRKYIYRNQK